MERRQLKTFITVAEELNFTLAAKKLYIAQPAVSQQIFSLEKSLNVQLFTRSKHHVALTHAGEAFFKDAKRMLKDYETAINKAQAIQQGRSGVLRIGLLSVSVRSFLREVVREFRRTFPDVHLQFDYLNTGQVIEKMNQNEIDIGFTLSQGIESEEEWSFLSLWPQTHCVVVPSDHPLADLGSVRLEQLRDESFVLLDKEEAPKSYENTMRLCEKHGFKPNVINEAQRIDAVLMIVDMGLGITIVPKHSLAYGSPTLKFIDIEEEDTTVDLISLWKKNNRNPVLAPFLNKVTEVKQRYIESEGA